MRSGEFVSFLGPSGCGKTTALRIVAGFEAPTPGACSSAARTSPALPANRRDMGMVFQAYSLFPNMTAQRERGLRAARARGCRAPERRQRAAELLELVGLASAARTATRTSSRAASSSAWPWRAPWPSSRSVLLLDEPLSALDAKVRVQLRDEIRRIQTQLGITTLFVTHDQEEALSVSDRVVVLSQGQIEQVGTPAEIYGNPRTAFVAQFVGTMNRVAGVVQRAGSGLVDAQGTQLRAASTTEWPDGSRVLLLLRPESIEVSRISEGASLPDGSLEGHVRGHTFLDR